MLSIRFDNSYARELEGLYIPWHGAQAPAPKMLLLNTALAEELGLNPGALLDAIAEHWVLRPNDRWASQQGDFPFMDPYIPIPCPF